MPAFKDRFPFDCLSCGEELDTKDASRAGTAFGTVKKDQERYDPDQHLYFVEPEKTRINDGTSEFEKFLAYATRHLVGPSYRAPGRTIHKQRPCTVHGDCLDSVMNNADLIPVDEEPVNQYGVPDRYTAEIPVQQFTTVFPALQGSDGPIDTVPDSDMRIPVTFEHIARDEEGETDALDFLD